MPIGGGQGQDRTADLPLFRRSVAFCPPSRKWIISPAHPHFRWRGCQVLRHGHGTTSAAVCRGMPFCPCYCRVDLRPGSGLVLLLCWRGNPGQPGTSAPAAGSRLFQPDGDSRRNAAHWRTRRRRTTRTLPGAPACAAGATLLHASTGRPSGNARCACCPSFCRRLQSPWRPEARLRTATRNGALAAVADRSGGMKLMTTVAQLQPGPERSGARSHTGLPGCQAAG